ncbi:MAG TPA: hypothetical protein VGL71_01080 [Urbifossiella sp.]|jgi:hypothetical protein
MDDVLKGVRDAREAFAEAHGFDIRAMVAALRALDEQDNRLIVRFPPRRATVTATFAVGIEDEKARAKKL